MSHRDSSESNVAGTFMDEFGGSFVNLVLGGILLWVGQTTFEHNGELAGIRQQLSSMTQRHEMLGDRYDRVVESLNQRTQSRFTSEDGEKLAQRIKSVEISESTLKDRLLERLGELRVQVSSLEVQFKTSVLQTTSAATYYAPRELSSIRADIAGIRDEMDRLGRVIRPSSGADSVKDSAIVPTTLHTVPVSDEIRYGIK